MSLSLNVRNITPIEENKLPFYQIQKHITEISPISPTPVDVFALKDVDGNYLYDSNNNKLFVRG